ncbi:MAG: recombinase family protein [Janthinobacterium lividum]
MRPVIGQLRDAGLSLDAIADRLTQDGVQTARGGSWTATTVRNVLLRKTAIADK